MRSLLPLLCFAAAHLIRAEDAPLLQSGKVIPLPGVKGRIDHLAVDVKTNRVFIAALGNNTVEVVDLNKGERIYTIGELDEPQGVAFIPESNQIVVANGGDGRCCFYDGVTYKLNKTVKLKGDADNVRYDAKSGRVVVGFASGALAFIESNGEKVASEVQLSAHPESFQIEQGGARIFVNVPGKKQFEVVDTEKNSVVAVWPLKSAFNNFPMTLDHTGHRLIAGCRSPAKVSVYDTASGVETASFDCVNDTDDLFYDAGKKRLYVIGGEGLINVFTQLDADHYRLDQTVKTVKGARTGLFIPEMSTLLLAVPQKGASTAELRCFKTN